jgi:hypothetical protein
VGAPRPALARYHDSNQRITARIGTLPRSNREAFSHKRGYF